MGRIIWEISAWSPMIEFVNFVQLLQKLLDFHTDVKQRRENKIYITVFVLITITLCKIDKVFHHYLSQARKPYFKDSYKISQTLQCLCLNDIPLYQLHLVQSALKKETILISDKKRNFYKGGGGAYGLINAKS